MRGENNQKLGDLFTSSREKGKDGLPLLSVTLTDGLVRRDSLDRRTETNIASSEHLLVREGDIAYNMMRVWQGALGRASCSGLVSPAYIVLRAKNGVDSRYAEYLFKTARMIYLFWAYSYGLTADRLRLYFNDFARIPARIPPLPEQKKIAQILSTWDQAITVTERLLENSQQRKKGLMQQLLTGKKRLPGFEGEFKAISLSAAATITMGTSPKSAAYNSIGDGLPLLQGNADIEGRRSKPRVYTSEITKACQPGDILLSVRAPVGSVAISNHEACIGRGICAIKAKNNNNQEFLYQWMLWYEPRWASLSQGSTFESVNSSDIKNLQIKLPEPREQKAISNVLSVADRESELLGSRLDQLKSEKKALMQQLLTGKRRVKVDAEAA
ncbi:restriction endonuclease subunit S [Marinimicrobium koreense]|uniref:restriction endonuclease subunit S n=1 Tax=Marinimicrobium koreense TaxID=306545 RepID=UPI003F70B1BE